MAKQNFDINDKFQFIRLTLFFKVTLGNSSNLNGHSGNLNNQLNFN